MTSFCANLSLWLSRLEAKAEELLAEEQADFRPGRSTVEQISVVVQKHLQYNISAIGSTTRLQEDQVLTESGTQACGRSLEITT